MAMQKPPISRQRSVGAQWGKAFDEEDKAGHLTNGLGPSKRSTATNSSGAVDEDGQTVESITKSHPKIMDRFKWFRKMQKSKGPDRPAFLTLPATQRTDWSLTQEPPDYIQDAFINDYNDFSGPFEEPTSENETSMLSPIPIATTRSPTAMEGPEKPGKVEVAIASTSRAEISQSSRFDLAIPPPSMPFPSQNGLEDEAEVVHQDAPQPDAELPTVDQQSPWFATRWSIPNIKIEATASEMLIGRPLALKSLGTFKCWEVKGAARDAWDQIRPDITAILASCGEDLNAKESVPLPILVGMYMIGKDERSVAPTILFSSQSRSLRRKAMKIVKKSSFFQNLQGFVLAECSEAPLSLAAEDEQSQFIPVESEQRTDVYLATAEYMDSLCGVPIFISKELERSFIFTKVATMGGLLQQGDICRGLTVAHSFLDTSRAQPSPDVPAEFAFDDSDDSDGSSDSLKLPLSNLHLESRLAPDVMKLGCTKTSSFNNELDYALIDIEIESFKAVNQISVDMNGGVKHIYSQDVSQFPAKDCQILAVTGSKRIIRGEISGVPYFLKAPFGRMLQEVRLIRLQSTIAHGDSGSWIIDSENGNLYGPIVAGYPRTEIAYIMSAKDILENINSRTGLDVRLPQSSNISIQESSKIPYPPNSSLTDADEKNLRQVVSNDQPPMETWADTNLYKPESSTIELDSFKAQDFPLEASSECSSEWGDNSTLGTPITEISGQEGYQGLPLKRPLPDTNYPYAKRVNLGERRGDSALRTSNPQKPSLPAPGPTISLEIPVNLGFLWSIDSIEAVYDDKHPPRILGVEWKSNDIGRYWFPPNRANMFRRRPGNLYRWRMGKSERLDNPPDLVKKFAVTSLFFQAKQNNFVAADKDCTRYDLANEDIGWAYIGFNHHPGHLSEVMIGGRCTELAAPADRSSWMPQVLPRVYNYNTRPPYGRPPSDIPGGLCGSLSLLIGMAAFSAEENIAEAVVCQCFGLGQWYRHTSEIGIGRYQGRGVLIHIYLDPEAEGVTINHLRAFERGRYGPIFGPFADSSDITESTYPMQTDNVTTQSLSKPVEVFQATKKGRQMNLGSYSTYPSEQDPKNSTKLYDTFTSTQELVDKDAMEEA